MAGEDDLDDDLDIVTGGEDGEGIEPNAGDQDEGEGEGGETVIGFADESDGEEEEGEEPSPLVKRLRDQLREANGKIAKMSRAPSAPANDGDPEPQVPAEPGGLDTFDYDEDKQRAAWREFNNATQAHADWKSRQDKRDADRTRQAESQAKQIEQQRNSLGVADYDEKSALVRDRLTDAQIGVLTNGAQNPAKLIYALGRSPSKLEALASEDNLARFAVMIGGMERDIKVMKRNAPAADTRVRGATASASLPSADKELARLEKEAERTNDRSKVIAYKREQRRQKAA